MERKNMDTHTIPHGPLANLPPMSAHDRLMRDLLVFLEDAGNFACDHRSNGLEHRADELLIRVRRQLQE